MFCVANVIWNVSVAHFHYLRHLPIAYNQSVSRSACKHLVTNFLRKLSFQLRIYHVLSLREDALTLPFHKAVYLAPSYPMVGILFNDLPRTPRVELPLFANDNSNFANHRMQRLLSAYFG